jgi:hypothetical protein
VDEVEIDAQQGRAMVTFKDTKGWFASVVVKLNVLLYPTLPL